MSTAALPPRRTGTPVPGLLWHQIRYEQLSFWRNTQNAVFTFAFPVVFMTVLGLLMRGGTASSYFYGRTPIAYYMPTIAALSVIGTCYGQLAVVLAMRRQDGILKRVRATPLPASLYFLGLLAHCLVVAVTDVALIIGIGALFGAPLACPLAGPGGHAGGGRRRLLRARRGRRLPDPQRGGGASGRAARAVPAALPVRDVPADSLGGAELGLRDAADPAVQPGAARRPHRARAGLDGTLPCWPGGGSSAPGWGSGGFAGTRARSEHGGGLAAGLLVGVGNLEQGPPDQREDEGRPGEGEPERRGDSPTEATTPPRAAPITRPPMMPVR